jgi:hypothetical protein
MITMIYVLPGLASKQATVLFLTNLLPSVTLDSRSPHLLLKGIHPPLDFLKPWGCLMYINLHKEQRDKGDPHCRPAMFIGYVAGSGSTSVSKSVFKCLDLLTLRTSNHSEIRFDEDLFPGPWIKRPAGFKPSIAQQRNPPSSAVVKQYRCHLSHHNILLSRCHFPL